MANIQATQAFYSLTLEAGTAPAGACVCRAIAGQAQDQQVFEARGQRVYLRRLGKDDETEQPFVETILEHNVFSTIRGVGAFRIPGTQEGMFTPCIPNKRCIMMEHPRAARSNSLPCSHCDCGCLLAAAF